VVGRWGGEEFIVLVQPPSEQLMTVADRIRSSIAARTGLVAQAPGLPVTVSIGGYCVAAAAEPVKDLLEHAIMLADAQLYEAKRSGRNCTKLHAESSPLR
jgi:diguanylate cyclase (GGDEF)-like protein